MQAGTASAGPGGTPLLPGVPIIPNRVKYKVKRQTLDKRNAHRLEPGQVVFAGNLVVSREKALVLVSLGTPEELLQQVRRPT